MPLGNGKIKDVGPLSARPGRFDTALAPLGYARLVLVGPEGEDCPY